MPKIIIRLLSAFIPVKSWRKSFRKKLNRRNLFGDLQSVFTEIKTKRDTCLAHKDSCKTIALGSSHCAYGINPKFISEDCFNLGSNSQDLYTAEHLLKYMQKQLPHLKKVILFLDVFTRGLCLERITAEHICASYQYLYNIHYPLFADKKHHLINCAKLDKRQLNVIENQNGYLMPPKVSCTYSVEERVQGCLREHNREISQYNHLINMIQLLADDKIEMIILIPPVRQDYQALLPHNLLLSDAQQLTKGTNVQVLDFSYDKDFTNDDFYDYDHLNPTGAEKLSIKIKGLL